MSWIDRALDLAERWVSLQEHRYALGPDKVVVSNLYADDRRNRAAGATEQRGYEITDAPKFPPLAGQQMIEHTCTCGWQHLSLVNGIFSGQGEAAADGHRIWHRMHP